ncbi:MAG: hypothetical protein ACREIC_16810 [Limisphaerales bacterium]
MRNPIGFLLALVFVCWGLAATFFPQWFYKVGTPEQAARDRKKVQRMGMLFLPVGVLMLIGSLVMHA